MKIKLSSQTLISYKYLITWMIISLLAGILGVFTLQAFVFLSSKINLFINTVNFHVIFWPLIGALITGGIVYRLEIGAAGEGMPSYIKGLKQDKGYLSFKVTFYKFWAALFTLSTFGNGGVVGPLGRVSAGLSVYIINFFKKKSKSITQEQLRIAAICGMAAVTGAVFHSSIGAGLFAVEIIQRRTLHYKDIFPAILTSSTAVFFSKVMGWGSFYYLETPDKFMDFSMAGWLIGFAVLVGFSGGLYSLIYLQIAKKIKRSEGNILLKVIVGSLVAFLISYSVNPGLIGTSKAIFDAVFKGDMNVIAGRLAGTGPLSVIVLIIIIVKILSNCITVGSGMSAGFTGPSALTGMLLGVAVSSFLNIEHASPTYYAFMAAGFSGMLASSMNVPLAAAVLSIEVFGLQYSFPAGVSAIIGFQMMRSSSIYDYAVNLKIQRESKMRK